MEPAQVELPAIWKGCDWLPILLKWKDANGNPLDLSGWTPYCQTVDGLSLNAQIIDALGGETTLSLTKAQTAPLKLGEVAWDWIWWNNQPAGTKYPPFLSGKVPIKEPKTENF